VLPIASCFVLGSSLRHTRFRSHADPNAGALSSGTVCVRTAEHADDDDLLTLVVLQWWSELLARAVGIVEQWTDGRGRKNGARRPRWPLSWSTRRGCSGCAHCWRDVRRLDG
jgi:hypothetical protein